MKWKIRKSLFDEILFRIFLNHPTYACHHIAQLKRGYKNSVIYAGTYKNSPSFRKSFV